MASKIRTIFPVPLVSIAFLLLASQSLTHSQNNWSCAMYPTDYSLDVAQMAGDWYEVLRVPEAAVPACVNIIAPAAIVDGQYRLQVEYVNNVDKKWERTKETLSFPWPDVEGGVFALKYGVGPTSVEVNFKIVASDSSLVVVCGYSSLSTSTALLKIMSRDRVLNATMEEKIKVLVAEYGDGVQIGSVEQSSKCNGAAALFPTLMRLLITILVLAARS